MSDDGRFWIELREPRTVPEMKGSYPAGQMAAILREFMRDRPLAYITVVTWCNSTNSPILQDGPECLQMLDGRSMSTGRKHIKSSAKAHRVAEV